MYHQIPNPIIAQTATTKRMYLPYASTSASSSRKLLIRDAPSRLFPKLKPEELYRAAE
ncbi:hypothetical protein CCACVL1_02962 [Corchorus capsularis]|uniref:Uncharacterized protein n=1 Tax=Corchorus capsularis TaxID=210143 RepID=A0A1R3K4E0_COCAP|nr:hypothetical protein CCACVL1_02962 [Corchorus capsularis]